MNAFFQKASGVLINQAANGPWRSKSVLTALVITLVGVGSWCSGIRENPPPAETGYAATNAPVNTQSGLPGAPATSHWNWSKPFPFYVPMGASYVAGFCIGWVFRKLIRMILAFTALVIALLALGKFAGCDVTPAQERVKRTSEWAQQKVTAEEEYLRRVLPSAASGGTGIFLGFRRRNKAAIPSPDSQTANPPRSG